MKKRGKRYRVYRGQRPRSSREPRSGRPGRYWSDEYSEPHFGDDPRAAENAFERAAERARGHSLDDTADGPWLPEHADHAPHRDEAFMPPGLTADDEVDWDEWDDSDEGYSVAPEPVPYRRGLPPEPPRRPIRLAFRWFWLLSKPLIALALIAALLIAGWGVAGYFGLRAGVSEANERLDDAARQHLTSQRGRLLSIPTTILFLGIDTGGQRTDIGRSDAILLLRTNPGERRISLLSVPRDLRVEIPGSGLNKINAAYATGGSALAIQTVKQLTDADVNHIAIVDFNGFGQVIDELGGVTVNVPQRIQSNRFDCPYGSRTACTRWDGWRFSRGEHTFDGERALRYARIRENRRGTGEIRITRGERQQQVLEAIVDKLISVNTFLRLPLLGDDIVGPLATDLSTTELFELAWVAFRASDENAIRCRLGGRPSDIEGVSYLIGADGNTSAVNGFLGRSPPRPPTAADGPFAPGCTGGTGGG